MTKREYDYHFDNLSPFGISPTPTVPLKEGKTCVSVTTGNDLFPYGAVGTCLDVECGTVLFNGERVQISPGDAVRFTRLGQREEYWG